MSKFKYEVMRGEWIAEVGSEDDVGSPQSFKAYWRSTPFATREEAIAALEAHPEVGEYSNQLMRYRMQKSYTQCQCRFRWVKVDEYEK